MLARSVALLLTLTPAAQGFGPTTKITPRFVTHLGPFRHYLNSLSNNPLGEPKIAGGHILDEEKRYASSSFPISPEDLIDLAKNVLRVRGGLDDGSVLADDFEFDSPFMAPLSKKEYLNRQEAIEVARAFPDLDNQYYNFHVDPFEFNRVWYSIRPVATHTGVLNGKPPTGKRLELPPQVLSLTFDAVGKVTRMTAGYVMDSRVGNTGGVGGTMGYIAGVDMP